MVAAYKRLRRKCLQPLRLASPRLRSSRCAFARGVLAAPNLSSGRRIGALRSACPCTPPIAVLVGLLTRCDGSARQGYSKRLRRPCLCLPVAVVVGLPRGGHCGAPHRPRLPRWKPYRGLAARSRSRRRRNAAAAASPPELAARSVGRSALIHASRLRARYAPALAVALLRVGGLSRLLAAAGYARPNKALRASPLRGGCRPAYRFTFVSSAHRILATR